MILDLPQLHPGQESVVSQARRYNVARCGRRYGKTTLAINRMLLHRERGALNGYPVGFFAPSSKYFSEIWIEVNEIVRPVITRSNITERQIRLYGGGIIDFWSLDKPGPGEGRKYSVVVFDECQLAPRLREQWQQSVFATLSDYVGDAWFFYKPKGSLGYANELYALGQGQDKDWISWSLKTEGNPYILKSEIEAARKQLPPSIFAQEYEAVPAADGGNPFGLDEIALCVAPISGNEPAVWAWDLAKSVDFTTGIALDAYGFVCRPVQHFQAPWDETEEIILRETNAPALVDSTGVGDPILERLQQKSSLFTGFKFSSPSKQNLMVELRTAISKGEIHFPPGVIKTELDTFQYEYTQTGTRYSAPRGLFDDAVMALALANHHLRAMDYERDPVTRTDVPNEARMAALVREQMEREEKMMAEELARGGIEADGVEERRWRRVF